MSHLPTWMLHPPTPDDWSRSPLPAGAPQRRVGRSVTRRTLGSIAGFVVELLDNAAIAEQRGLLQSIDPRAKMLGLVGLIVAATLVQRPATLALAYGACLLLGVLSRVPARRLLRTWLIVPLFSAGVMLPVTLNVITPGAPVWILWRFAGDHWGPWALPDVLALTDVGLLVAGRLVLRAAVCVSLALLLAATTRPERLFRGLRALGVPQIFIMLLTMMQRYLTALLRAAEEIHLAKVSRSIAPSPLRREQAWVAAGVGALYRRTRLLGHAVYLAMLARGYTGEVHALAAPRWRVREWAFLAAAAALALAQIYLG